VSDDGLASTDTHAIRSLGFRRPPSACSRTSARSHPTTAVSWPCIAGILVEALLQSSDVSYLLFLDGDCCSVPRFRSPVLIYLSILISLMSTPWPSIFFLILSGTRVLTDLVDLSHRYLDTQPVLDPRGAT